MNTEYWVEWSKAAAIRAIKTMAQTGIALIGTNLIGVADVDWVAVGSVALVAGIVSLLTSLAGLPEVEKPVESDEV